MKMRNLEAWGVTLLYCGYPGEEFLSLSAADSGEGGKEVRIIGTYLYLIYFPSFNNSKNTSTTLGSNWIPENFFISFFASLFVILFLYGLSLVKTS